jgi:hypothetical protein
VAAPRRGAFRRAGWGAGGEEAKVFMVGLVEG